MAPFFANALIFFTLTAGAFGQSCQDDRVCYPRAGCFDRCPPFDEMPLPWSPEQIGLNYALFTRSNPTEHEEIDENNLGSYFNASWPTVFTMHGFVGSPDGIWNMNLKDELLERGDFNVIHVAWENGSDPDPESPFEPYPMSNARVVGAVTANLSLALQNERGMHPASAHCAGFSIGSHACAYYGKNYPGLGRITGLDPAGPGFDTMTDTRGHLWHTDAQFVDVIHTNGWDYSFNSGSQRQAGHVDFWPNKAGIQPGCELGVCAHFRGPDFFVETVNSVCEFTAYECGSVQDMRDDLCAVSCDVNECQEMGYNAINNPGRGNFVLATNANPPYCQ